MSDDEDALTEDMSEEEIDAELRSLMNQHNENIDRMSRRQYYEYRRNRRLDLCVKQRQIAREFPEIFLPRLKDTQRRLLALRIEYRTNAQVGHG